jgi:transposase
VHDLREIVNAILYVNRAGCAWRLLPHDFPPYRTVYDYYAKWEKDGTTQAIRDLLRGRVREQAGRAAGSDRGDHRRAGGHDVVERSRGQPGV